MRDYKIVPKNIYNIDESSLETNDTKNVRWVTVPAEKDPTYFAAPYRHIDVTALECICDDGGYIDPFIIFSGISTAKPCRLKNRDVVSEWPVYQTKTAWINNELCMKWLTEVFVPQTSHQTQRNINY